MEINGTSIWVYIVLTVIVLGFCLKMYVLLYETKMSYLRDKKLIESFESEPSEADLTAKAEKKAADEATREAERKASKDAERQQRIDDENASREAWMQSVRQLHAEGINVMPPLPANLGRRKK